MAANQRQSSYHYDRPGVVMITLNAREGVRLAEITPRDYRLTELGALVKDHLLSIPKFYPQISAEIRTVRVGLAELAGRAGRAG